MMSFHLSVVRNVFFSNLLGIVQPPFPIYGFLSEHMALKIL